MAKRTAVIRRETKETRIAVDLHLDGTGIAEISSGVGMLDHLIEQLARHGRFDLKLLAEGDLEIDSHHTVEDVGITLGQAFLQALGDRKGIVRMANAIVPMDEALAMVSVDISGRGYAKTDVSFRNNFIGELPTDMIVHLLESLANEGKFNLHCSILSGRDDHHKAEALFKALGRALDEATKIDERIMGEIPSTKGIIA